MARQPPAHELAQRLEVALLAEVLLRIGRVVSVLLLLRVLALVLVLDHAAEARADGIDEHEVAEGEPRCLVLDESRRHRGKRAVRREVDPLRTDRSHVEVGRGCARAAVEDERDGPFLVASLGDVRHGEDLGRRLLLLPQDDPLRGRAVVDRRLAPCPGGGDLGTRRRLVVGLGVPLVVFRGHAAETLPERHRTMSQSGAGSRPL